MKIKSFHHPDLCPVVLRRRATEQVLDFLEETVAVFSTRGRYLLWKSCYPSTTAYRSAMYRLRKAGLVAYRRDGGRMPVIKLTHKGERRVSEVCRRREPWPKKWNGIWYVLTFDVPEKDRPYREELRAFLKEMRMGCLQKSVYVTARDIRPEYDDLVKAAGVDEFSYLFEARTVLGRSPEDIVQSAWNFDRVTTMQRWYLNVYQDNLKRLGSGNVREQTVLTLAREEATAYVTVMSEDPLLPRPLWPKGYMGEKAWRFHRRFLRQIAKHLP